jgi:outer membrane protein assembly factor BamB
VLALIIGPLLGLTGPIMHTNSARLVAAESDYSSGSGELDPSVTPVEIGLTGRIGTEIVTTELDGKQAVLLGTSKGLYIVSEGELVRFISTPGAVTDVVPLADSTGDGQPEIALAINDSHFPNIRCYDGANGDKLWHFAPSQDAFVQNLLWTGVQTPTFDMEAAADVNGDGYQDVAATSGYCLYLLDGRDGQELWRFDAEDNLWEVSSVPDVDGDGTRDFAVGAQAGVVYMLSGQAGGLLWQSNIAEECVVFDEQGEMWATIDRCVWSIVSVTVQGREKLAVSSEDGKVRLVDAEKGSLDWESAALFDGSSSFLYQYYSGKGRMPTSPGDANFFNLRLYSVPDIGDDGTGDLLAVAHMGKGTGQGGPVMNSGLFAIDSASGGLLWDKTSLSLDNAACINPVVIDEEHFLVVPQAGGDSRASIALVALADGAETETLEFVSGGSGGQSRYWIQQCDDGSVIVASDSDDLLCVSTEGEVLWHYPRIGDVAVEEGEFTGDETPDLLVWSKQRLPGWDNTYGARVLYVVDGATQESPWSYEIPYEDLGEIAGIANILVTPDLDDDGKQDIVGYVQPQSSGGYGEDYKLMAFSGADGSVLLDQAVVTETYYGLSDQLYKARESSPEEFASFVNATLDKGVQEAYYSMYPGLADKPYLKTQVDEFVAQILGEGGEYDPGWLDNPEWIGGLEQWLNDGSEWRTINKRIRSLDVINLKGDVAFLVGCQQEVFIIDAAGDLLWFRTYNPWAYEDPFVHSSPAGWAYENEWERSYRSLGDINEDGIDDLLAYDWGTIFTRMSVLEEDRLNFDNECPGSLTLFTAEPGCGTDPSRIELVGDVDGDGLEEVLFPRNEENKAPVCTIVSPVTGQVFLQWEASGGQGDFAYDFSSADFNNDGYSDHTLFWRWRPGSDRPEAEVVSGRDGSVLWQFAEFQESWAFEGAGLRGLMPATGISDMSGDGTPDLALIKFLHDQPGAVVSIYDVAQNQLVKEIVLEEINEKVRWERRWHPGASIKEVGDCNGDGVRDVAVVTMLTEDSGGQGEQGGWQKEAWLMVIDVSNERAIAEFKIVGSQLLETGNEGEFAILDSGGGLYFVNVLNSLQITAPNEGSAETSPVTITWDGVPTGAFNQVFIDNAEVARTNDNTVLLDVARGEHELVLRSLDEYGRGIYTAATFEVQKGSNAVVVASLLLVALVLVAVSPVVSKRVRSRRRRLRHGQ